MTYSLRSMDKMSGTNVDDCHVIIHHCHVIRIHFHEIIVYCHVIKIHYHVTKSVDIVVVIVTLTTFRYATKMEVLDLLKRSGYVLQVMVVAGGLWATPRPSAQARIRQHHITRETVEKRHNKAKVFQNKVHTAHLSWSSYIQYNYCCPVSPRGCYRP